MIRIEDEFISDCALGALEAVELFVPGPFREVDVELEPGGELPLRFKSAHTEIKGSFDRPRGVEFLRDLLDPFQWAPPASAAFSRLQEELAGRGASWDGRKAHFSVSNDRATLTFGTAAQVDIPPALYADRLMTDALGQALERESPPIVARQNALAKELSGMKRWDWDGPTGRLLLDLPSGKKHIPAVPLGSFSREFTYLWGWANRSFDPKATQGLRALAEKSGEGLGALRRRGFYCSEDFALRVSLIAAARLGLNGVFPPRTQSMMVFFGLRD